MKIQEEKSFFVISVHLYTVQRFSCTIVQCRCIRYIFIDQWPPGWLPLCGLSNISPIDGKVLVRCRYVGRLQFRSSMGTNPCIYLDYIDTYLKVQADIYTIDIAIGIYTAHPPPPPPPEPPYYRINMKKEAHAYVPYAENDVVYTVQSHSQPTSADQHPPPFWFFCSLYQLEYFQAKSTSKDFCTYGLIPFQRPSLK